MKSLNITILIYCIAFSIKLSSAQTYNPTPQTWVINAETATCSTGNAECLLVKQPGKKEFEILDESIVGFTYEKGNTYTIIVKQELKQPPIGVGESIYKYVLVRVVSKKSANSTNATTNSTTYTSSAQKIFEVNYETVPCEDDNSKSCLLVKEKGKKEFEILNATISGFNYKPGYSYIIAVKATNDGNYYLVNEISKKFVKNTDAAFVPNENKEPVAVEAKPAKTTSTSGKIIVPTSIQASSTLDGKWYLRKMKDELGASFNTDNNVMWIQINTFSDRMDGMGACNKFAAVVRSDLNTTFGVSKITSGFSKCGNQKIEDLFYDLLEQATRYEIKDGILSLFNQWNFLLGFVSDANNKKDIKSDYTAPPIVVYSPAPVTTQVPTTKNEDKYVPPVISSTETANTTIVKTSSYESNKPSGQEVPETIKQDDNTKLMLETAKSSDSSTTITTSEAVDTKPSVPLDPCDPDVSGESLLNKTWDVPILGDRDEGSNLLVTGQIEKSDDGYFFNLVITKSDPASNTYPSKYVGVKGSIFYFIVNHQKSVEFVATDVINNAEKEGNITITKTKLICKIKEENLKLIKKYFASAPVDAVNIKLENDFTINELLSSSKAKTLQDKLTCFFNKSM